ncbi:MAG: DNA polymerase I [Ruminococcaceae bacterium]|nr:DNA polymerase I [Oscillospiraceae bacterium]
MKKILAVDGNSILNRAFYGIRLLSTRKGVYTNAIYGLINIVMKQVEQLSPDYCAVAFDVKKPTFRHKLYESYKAGRHATPPELLQQIPIAKECMRALGLTTLELEGYEADDILGTLSAFAEKEGAHAYLLTGDKDSLQLISENTTVLLATNNDTVPYDKEAFFVKYGVAAEQFVDVKALMGDSSDHIPGVAGIGEKTALKLISDFGDLDALYAALPSSALTRSTNEKLQNGKESAYLSQILSRIVRDVPVLETLEEISYRGADKPKAYNLFMDLEFSGFIKRFGLEEMSTAVETEAVEATEAEYTAVDAEALVAKLEKAEYIALAIEGKGYLFTDGKRYFRYNGDPAALETFFNDQSHKFICYDCKTIYKNLRQNGVDFRGVYHDVMLGAYVLDPSESSFDFERLCISYLNKMPNGLDIRYLLPLYEAIEAKISENGQENLLYRIEMPLASVLADMELCGCRVDMHGLEEYGEKLLALEEEYKARIYFHAGGEFNVNSPKQLGEILFERLMLPAEKKTKNGYSTNAEILEKLRSYHPIIDDILDYRQVAKLRGTYAEGLVKAADGEGKIHTTFKQTGTATGRLSSSDPNLQNIPIKTELGREFRRFFLPQSEEYVLIDADYSQIELRLLADISGDENMRAAFRDGVDIHTSTASRVFGVSENEVTVELRKRAKAVNFGIVYGIGAFSLAEDLGISRASAKEYIESYLATYPAVDRYLKDIIQEAYEKGYVTTSFGRRRYIPELAEKNKMRRSFGERVAMNSPIQGTAADIIKLAMIRVADALAEKGFDARILLQVHDELLIEARRDEADEVLALLRREMENAATLSVPLEAEVGVGENWYECH